MSDQPTCKARWAAHKNDRLSDLRRLIRADELGEDSKYAARVRDDIGSLFDYGLSFDYVAPGTLNNQREGYWRYQISYGGPSEEFRFYSSGLEYVPYRVTFAFLDWFDGYERKLSDRDAEVLLNLWEWFSEAGIVESEYRKTTTED